jgi:hypothetical protein
VRSWTSARLSGQYHQQLNKVVRPEAAQKPVKKSRIQKAPHVCKYKRCALAAVVP